MIPVVNQKYKYILLYSAKSGCTSLRSLYLSIHQNEMTNAQLIALNGYHNLNQINPYDNNVDYSDYFVYTITRNPYMRAVSGFLDQYISMQNTGVKAMMTSFPPVGNSPNSFIEFLEYLSSVPDEKRDIHFQTQAYFQYSDRVVTPVSSIFYRLFGSKLKPTFGINLVGDISDFDNLSKLAFKNIFNNHPVKYDFAIRKLNEVKRRNSSFYGKQNISNAASLPISELNNMMFAPKPQDFYNQQRAIDLVNEIYREDFELFGYTQFDIPHKSASKEIEQIPDDFDWQMYLRLNPDLPAAGITNRRSAIRHYLENGRFEVILRAYKIEAPKGFDWQRYLELNADLIAQGVTHEASAIEHYLSYGVRQQRRIE